MECANDPNKWPRPPLMAGLGNSGTRKRCTEEMQQAAEANIEGPSYVSRAISALAEVLNEQGKREEAEPLYRSVLERARQRGGWQETSSAMLKLAVFLEKCGKADEAGALMQERSDLLDSLSAR